jgi:GMP synthase-like glutamine amidotransferase
MKEESMPTCLVVQHLEPEGPYAIADALTAAGVALEVRQVFAGATLPSDLADFDGLVVMGGPMSAQIDAGFPTRRSELELLAWALDRGVPTLGVCLGAQLLALAAGGTVSRGSTGPEIGWGPVELTDEADEDTLLAGLPHRLDVLHWHGDTFELPTGGVHLAASSKYRSQAFRCGPRAWGLQFHLEVDERAVGAFLTAFGADVAAGASAESIRAQSAAALEILGPHRALVLNRFAELVATFDREQLVELP